LSDEVPAKLKSVINWRMTDFVRRKCSDIHAASLYLEFLVNGMQWYKRPVLASRQQIVRRKTFARLWLARFLLYYQHKCHRLARFHYSSHS